ncbi:MAG: sugar ABC transporter permease [Oscillospiraceae bacterium]|jgi:multiple sugar transport system permease protein|nr:sugar ABC transporter permease [Oscillospiraceae bacterium]
MPTRQRIRGLVEILLFIAPAMIPLIVFWVYPIVRTIAISFTDWDYMTPSYHIVGLRNYVTLLKSSAFSSALNHTLTLCVSSAAFTIVGGLLLSLLLFNAFRGVGLYKALVFSPWITPTVAVSLVWMWIFDPDHGIANAILRWFHLPGSKWMASSQTAMICVIIVTVWKSMGYASIFYLTALEKVPKSLYEASSLDGANVFQQFLHITLSGVSPTTFFLVVVTTINGLQAYDQIQILTQGGPAGSTRTLLYLYYQLGFQQFKMGEATAAAVALLVIVVAFTGAQNEISKRLVTY